MSLNKARKPVLDASAVIALMNRETGWERLQQLEGGATVNAVNVAEVLAKLVNRGMPHAAAQAAFNALYLTVTSFEPAMAIESVKFVGKDISLGDRCFLASCMHGSGWTSDHDLRAVAEKAGIPDLNFFR